MIENISDRLVRELEMNPEAKLEDVICLQEWCISQNLPLLKDFELLEFHHNCFYSIESTKQCIESYFKIRRSTPELFTKRDIEMQPLKDYCLNISQCIPIGATKEGYQIIASRCLNPSLHNYTLDFIQFTLVTDLLLHKVGTFPGIIILIDNTNSSIQQIMWAKWSHVRTILRYMHEGMPVRLHSIELISSSIFAKVALAAIQPFTNAQILDKDTGNPMSNPRTSDDLMLKKNQAFLTVNNLVLAGSKYVSQIMVAAFTLERMKIVFYDPSDISLLHQKIPREFLPKEFGGLMPSCDELNRDYIQTVTAMKNYFDEKDAFESDSIK